MYTSLHPLFSGKDVINSFFQAHEALLVDSLMALSSVMDNLITSGQLSNDSMVTCQGRTQWDGLLAADNALKTVGYSLWF